MAEIALIHRLRKENPFAGLVVFWVILMKAGYQRNISTLFRFMKQDGMDFQKPKNPKRVSKKYEEMRYPGERVQVDVKVVPNSCIEKGAQVRGDGWFQYTAIDEYSRFRFVEGFEEHNGNSSVEFLDHLVKALALLILLVKRWSTVGMRIKCYTKGEGNQGAFDGGISRPGAAWGNRCNPPCYSKPVSS
jgi:hypothetical protein